MESINEFKKGKYTVKVSIDESPWDPRGDENFGKMICFHKRYDLGDKHDFKADDFNSWEELERMIKRKFKAAVILPLYLYDHSGITMSTSEFSCRWDSGRVGLIYCTKADVKEMISNRKEGSKLKRAIKMLEAEVNDYDHYISGQVYGYEIFKKGTKESLESSWGYYSEEECMEEGKSALAELTK